jgi:hypothetical protein
MTHKREQEELLKRKAATDASVVPIIPDREKGWRISPYPFYLFILILFF